MKITLFVDVKNLVREAVSLISKVLCVGIELSHTTASLKKLLVPIEDLGAL